MSNHLAIAAITTVLRDRLHNGVQEFSSPSVTTLPPDVARKNISSYQLNLFLYAAQPNAAFVNLPDPPIALTLFYLITAWGEDDHQIDAHALLGKAVSILQTNPELTRAELEKAGLAPAEPRFRHERVLLSPFPLSQEDMFKMWTGFQTQYRISVAYQASIALIDSPPTRPTPLPVLTRGIDVAPSTLPHTPTITAIQTPGDLGAARVKDTLSLVGVRLAEPGTVSRVQFMHPMLAAPIVLDATGDASTLQLTLPATEPWIAGIYAVRVLVGARRSNHLALVLAPRLSNSTVTSDATGTDVTSTCEPRVLPAQRVALILADQEVVLGARNAPTAALAARFLRIPPGNYPLRVRVAGIDSIIVDLAEPAKFDPTQQVSVP